MDTFARQTSFGKIYKENKLIEEIKNLTVLENQIYWLPSNQK